MKFANEREQTIHFLSYLRHHKVGENLEKN